MNEFRLTETDLNRRNPRELGIYPGDNAKEAAKKFNELAVTNSISFGLFRITFPGAARNKLYWLEIM